MTQVAELNCYPIKSCAGIPLETASFNEQGIALDREWMVADVTGKFISQRQHSSVALVVPRIIGRTLSVNAPGMEELTVGLDDMDYPAVQATVWGNEAPAIAQSSEADEWFSDYIGADVQLLRKDPEAPRYVKPVYQRQGATNRVGFADGASLLLASQSSLDALNERLETPVPMNRFRPNIVVAGDDLLPFEEDYWRELKIGELGAFAAWACARCVITEIDQSNASKGKQVLKGLQGFRKGVDAINSSNKGVFFGQNVLHAYEEGVTVSVGDEVVVIERADHRNVDGIAG